MIRLGFHVLKAPERRAFLEGTKVRMRQLVELALRGEAGEDELVDAARRLTKRRSRGLAARQALARNVGD